MISGCLRCIRYCLLGFRIPSDSTTDVGLLYTAVLAQTSQKLYVVPIPDTCRIFINIYWLRIPIVHIPGCDTTQMNEKAEEDSTSKTGQDPKFFLPYKTRKSRHNRDEKIQEIWEYISKVTWAVGMPTPPVRVGG